MLTVDQIKEVKFKKASIGGYRVEEVDIFIDEVVATVEDLKKKNAEIIAKSELLMKKVEEYRNDEDSVSQVLLKAQKDADKTVKEAKKQAAQIVKDANAEASKIVADADTKIVNEKEMLVQIVEEAAEIRKKLIEEFSRQIESLKILPDENEPKELKEHLDEKYPVEIKPVEKEQPDDGDKEDGFTSIEDAAKDAVSATEDSANAEAAAADEETEKNAEDSNESEPVNDSVKDGKIQIDKSKFENRFGKLKFGEDYDVKKGG